MAINERNHRVEKHIIKENHPMYKMLDKNCFLNKNLYNFANYHIRQTFIICSKLANNKDTSQDELVFINMINNHVKDFNELKKINFEKAKLKAVRENKKFTKKLKQLNKFDSDNKYLGYEFLEFVVKNSKDYKSLMAQNAQQTLKLLDKNWKSFFEGIKKWSKNKTGFSGRPKLPKYLKKNGRQISVFTNQNCKLKDGKINFPTIFNSFTLNTKITKGLQQVRILPRNRHLVVEVVYKIYHKEKLEDNGKYIAIDIGVSNLATIVNNVGVNPIIINGKGLKSINQYYNKNISHYREIAKRMNKLDYTKRMNRLTIKRNNKVTDCMHKASKNVIEYALGIGANTIVIGNNKDWKRESNLSKKVNQSFVGIPHQLFIEKIIYKAESVGLNVVITEESYTSGTSFLDNEEPIKVNYNKSRRKYRGLFVSNKGVEINADVNGAYQIMKKVFPKAFADGIEGVGLHPIRVSC